MQSSKEIPKHYIDGFSETVNLTKDFMFPIRIKGKDKKSFNRRMRRKIFKKKINLDDEMI